MKNVVCFGEVLWDVYPDGKKLGGAPFNVAAHLRQLGTCGHTISRVGADALGREILDAMEKKKISLQHTQTDPELGTGVVNVLLDNKGIPSYDIKNPSAWDNIVVTSANKELVSGSNAFVYGTLASRNEQSRSTLFELMELSNLNICDLNIRQEFYSKALIEKLLSYTDILKINDDEGELLCELLGIHKKDVYTSLSIDHSIDIIIMTKGKDGAEVFKKAELTTASAMPIKVVDTVGSGDAFLAAFIHNHLAGCPLSISLDAACRLGAYVATKPGAIPEYNFDSLIF